MLNTHALHNAAIIRKLLPRHLTAPIPYIDPHEREAAHHRMASTLRRGQDERRAKEAAARKERRETATAKKAAQGAPTSTVDNVESCRPGQDGEGHALTSRARPRKRARLAPGPSTLQDIDQEGGDSNVERP